MGEFFIWGTFIGTFLFLMPIFVSIDGYFDFSERKIWFSIGFFHLIKVFGGYVTFDLEGTAIHLTKKKAIFVPYRNTSWKKFEITKGFQLYRIHHIIETGNVHAPISVLWATALQTGSAQVFSILQTKHPFMSLKSNTLLSQENNLKLSAQAVAVFNGLVLTIALTKKTLEVIINWIRKKRLIKSWKARQKNLRGSLT